jgi:hypothetical protein
MTDSNPISRPFALIAAAAADAVLSASAAAMKQLCKPFWALALFHIDGSGSPSECRFGLEFDHAGDGQQPAALPASRFAASTQLAVFEAVNAIKRDHQPYLGTITAPASASPEAAAHDVLNNYFPATAATLDAALASSLAGIPEGSAKTAGITVRQAAGRRSRGPHRKTSRNSGPCPARARAAARTFHGIGPTGTGSSRVREKC